MACTRAAYPAAAATTFLQLAAGSNTSTRPVLDFLLPRCALYSQSPKHSRNPSFKRLNTASRTQGSRGVARPSSPAPRQLGEATTRHVSRNISTRQATPHTRRYFSATPLRRNTRTVYNPQLDDDGQEMKLEITQRAGNRLSEIMAKDQNPHLALRIQVESGGCHGFQYLMTLVTLPNTPPSLSSATALSETDPPASSPAEGADSGAIREDDTVFAFASDGSGNPEVNEEAWSLAPKIVLDQPSLELLKGSKVDFTMELIGSQFKIVDNPLATSSCGCGTSFDIKI